MLKTLIGARFALRGTVCFVLQATFLALVPTAIIAQQIIKVEDGAGHSLGECRQTECKCDKWTVHYLKTDGLRWGSDDYPTFQQAEARLLRAAGSADPDYQHPDGPYCQVLQAPTAASQIWTQTKARYTEVKNRLDLLRGEIEDIVEHSPTNTSGQLSSTLMPRPLEDYQTLLNNVTEMVNRVAGQMSRPTSQTLFAIDDNLARAERELEQVEAGISAYRVHHKGQLPSRSFAKPTPTPIPTATPIAYSL
jgi:hypothetical protein